MDVVRSVISEKLSVHQYRELYSKSLEVEQVKRAMVVSSREVYGSVKRGRGNLKRVWRKDEVKAVVRRNEAACKEVLGARDEEARERCLEVYKAEKRTVKRCIYQSKKKVNEQFEGR